MFESINFDQLPLKDLIFSGILIFIMSVFLSNISNPLWGFMYAFGNILTLTFLGWLYQETWNDPSK